MSVQVSTRVDEKTKQKFDYICQKIGLSPASAMSVFIQAVINENGIPFALKYSGQANLDDYVQQNKRWLDEGLGQLKQGKVHTLTLSEDD
ncbi:MAG: type II toxin-antitoxin system RelB/DinJ family antitoxin [Clostridiales bacterium]|nr:type II toxin-antitoxin system RelB/DinJ family antitoxin [Clostridiales bacterium]